MGINTQPGFELMTVKAIMTMRTRLPVLGNWFTQLSKNSVDEEWTFHLSVPSDSDLLFYCDLLPPSN